MSRRTLTYCVFLLLVPVIVLAQEAIDHGAKEYEWQKSIEKKSVRP